MMDPIVMILVCYLWIDSGIVQQIRERTNNDGTSEYEYYIHYIDCNLSSSVVND